MFAPDAGPTVELAPFTMPRLIPQDHVTLREFMDVFQTVTNEDRSAADRAEREVTIQQHNDQLLKEVRKSAQQRLDVALVRCCQKWFSGPAKKKKKKKGNSETLLGLCAKWWREVKEILIWRAQPVGVRVEVGASSGMGVCWELVLCV